MAEQSINIYEDPKKVRAQIKQERKKLRQQEKQQYKDFRKREKEFEEQEAELDQSGGGITSFVLTVLIVLMWLLIMSLLIRLDVGGFGSTVMAPILRDVPYLNRILPEYARGDTTLPSRDYSTTPGSTAADGADATQSDSNAAYIERLEADLAAARAQVVEDAQTIEQLQAENGRLKTFEEQLNALEDQRLRFYNDIIYNDNAPDISEYLAYYEMIDPAHAAELYKQVAREIVSQEDVEEYVRSYSAMKPKQAAAIFDEMVENGTEHDVVLAARILMQMTADDRGTILGRMDPENASKLTDIMEPVSLPYP